MKLKKPILSILLLLTFILLFSNVIAEDQTLPIRLVNNVPGRAIFTYLIAKDLDHEFIEAGETSTYWFEIIIKRELSEEEISDLVKELPQYERQMRGIFNTTDSLFREMQWQRARIIENLSLDESGRIVSGVIMFKDSSIGDIVAKRASWEIRVERALINFTERKIYVYNKGSYSIHDEKTKAWYFYEAFDEPYEEDMKISYTYDKLGSFWLDAPNTKVKIYCYLPGDDFCSYVTYFIDQSSDFALNIRDFTRISGMFNYTWIYNSFLIKKNSSGAIVAGVKIPLIKRFLYSSYFDLRSKNLAFLVSEAENEYLFCYGEIDGKLQYSLAEECEFKIIAEGEKEIGITTEIQTKNVKILKPSNEEELIKIMEILRG